jgi:hypothetical protein
MSNDCEERRKGNEEMHRKLDRVLFILEDEHVGVCKTLKKHDEAIYGNGWIGIKTQILLISIAIALLGTDSPSAQKFVKWILR